MPLILRYRLFEHNDLRNIFSAETLLQDTTLGLVICYCNGRKPLKWISPFCPKKSWIYDSNVLVPLANHVDAFCNPENASDTNAIHDTSVTFRGIWKTNTSYISHHWCPLKWNFGDDANHSHSNRCKLLMEPGVSYRLSTVMKPIQIRSCRLTQHKQ